jgi:nucleoporin POM152
MPQQRGGPVPEAHRIALIPSSTMEFPVQRRWAAGIFAALQAWKAADLLLVYTASDPEQYSSMLFKWGCSDILYLLALYIARIPWLQFSFLKTIVLAFAFIIFNNVAFIDPTVSEKKKQAVECSMY